MDDEWSLSLQLAQERTLRERKEAALESAIAMRREAEAGLIKTGALLDAERLAHARTRAALETAERVAEAVIRYKRERQRLDDLMDCDSDVEFGQQAQIRDAAFKRLLAVIPDVAR